MKPTFKDFTSARLKVVELYIESIPNRPECREILKINRANAEFLRNALDAYEDYLCETSTGATNEA